MLTYKAMFKFVQDGIHAEFEDSLGSSRSGQVTKKPAGSGKCPCRHGGDELVAGRAPTSS